MAAQSSALALVAASVAAAQGVDPQADGAVAAPLDGPLQRALATNPDLRPLYVALGGARIWIGAENLARRGALFAAIAEAGHHGLPTARYALAELRTEAAATPSEPDTMARTEIRIMRAFLDYAGDLTAGALDPRKAARGIKRSSHRPGHDALLAGLLAAGDPATFLAQLAPGSSEYRRLLRARAVLRDQAAAGGYGRALSDGPLLHPGERDPRTPILRARLAALGYDTPAPAADADPHLYDAPLAQTLRAFQRDNGLSPDGVIGARTRETLNMTPARRMALIDVALERERWLNIDRGARHIMVNLADFTVRLIDDGDVTFETRAVVGATLRDKQTPEFSERMRYLEVNPDWTVPDGIIRRDYLPQLQEDPFALGHLELIDREGQPVARETVDFASYTPRTFPFMLRQPPGDENALGRVKFMFPNPYAIYLHDTPEKKYFERDVRTYSSGCVRLADPFDLAYVLLMRQMDDPVTRFDAVLEAGRQTRINLAEPVPVHIDYRTAFIEGYDRVQYRPDVYGRDAAVLAALIAADQPPVRPTVLPPVGAGAGSEAGLARGANGG